MASAAASVATKIVTTVWNHSKTYRNTVARLEAEIHKALALHVSRAAHDHDTAFQRDVLYPRIGSCIELMVALRSAGTWAGTWRSFFDDSLDRVQVAIDDLIAARRQMESQRLSLSAAPAPLPSPPPSHPPAPNLSPVQITFFAVNLSQRVAN